MTRYLRVRTAHNQQEVYGTAADAKARATALRKVGLLAKARAYGPQVTGAGRVKLYGVHIVHDGLDVPDTIPESITDERL